MQELWDSSDVVGKITFHPLGQPALERWACKNDQIWEVMQQIEDKTFSGFPMIAVSENKVGLELKDKNLWSLFVFTVIKYTGACRGRIFHRGI